MEKILLDAAKKGVWYLDGDRLMQIEEDERKAGLWHELTTTEIKPDGSTEWKIAVRYGGNPLVVAESRVVEQMLKRAGEWAKRYPSAVVESGSKWQSKAGSDPEMFLEDAGGNLIPAFTVLPDKKAATKKWDGNYGYWDGFQAELMVTPSTCHEKLVDNIRTGMATMLAEARMTVPNARIAFKTVVDVPEKILATAAPEHVALGCKPSSNAYEMEGLHVEEPRELKQRFAGGHYHEDPLGWRGRITPAVAARMAKAADMFAGVPSVAMFQKWDNPVRRIYYGLAGEHRVPKHGVEYRVLSNAWLFHPGVAHLAMELVRAGMKLGFRDLHGIFHYDEVEVKKIILDGDVDGAKRHVERNKGLYKAVLGPSIEKTLTLADHGVDYDRVIQTTLAALANPINNFAPMESVEDNWCLNGKREWLKNSRSEGANWWSTALRA